MRRARVSRLLNPEGVGALLCQNQSADIKWHPELTNLELEHEVAALCVPMIGDCDLMSLRAPAKIVRSTKGRRKSIWYV